MAITVKYQDKIHKGFVSDVLVAEKRRELEEALADKPELLAALKDNPFNTAEGDAILAGNVSICDYFATKIEAGEALEFDSPRSKTVKQTVRANVSYYHAVEKFYEEETEEEYAGVYKKILSSLKDYFTIAAEDILEDVYGDSYKQYKADYTAKEEERQAARVEARKKNAEENAG